MKTYRANIVKFCQRYLKLYRNRPTSLKAHLYRRFCVFFHKFKSSVFDRRCRRPYCYSSISFFLIIIILHLFSISRFLRNASMDFYGFYRVSNHLTQKISTVTHIGGAVGVENIVLGSLYQNMSKNIFKVYGFNKGRGCSARYPLELHVLLFYISAQQIFSTLTLLSNEIISILLYAMIGSFKSHEIQQK